MLGTGFCNFAGRAERGDHVDATQAAQAVDGSHDLDRMVVDPGRAAFLRAQSPQVRPVHNHGTGLAQQLSLPGGEHLGEHHGVVRSADAREIDRDSASGRALGTGARAPVAIDPDIGFHGRHIGVHAQAHLHIAADIAPEVHALRARIAHPEIGRRSRHVDRGRAEDAQHQGGLHGQQNARKAHGEHRRDKASPLMDQRLARQGNHG